MKLYACIDMAISHFLNRSLTGVPHARNGDDPMTELPPKMGISQTPHPDSRFLSFGLMLKWVHNLEAATLNAAFANISEFLWICEII